MLKTDIFRYGGQNENYKRKETNTDTMEFYTYKTTGLYHLRNHLPCQDAVYAGKKGRYGLAVIADGVSASLYGALGASLTCEAFQDFVRLEGGRLFQYKKEKTAYLLTEHILYFIETKGFPQVEPVTAKEGKPDVTDFACTLSAVCLDMVTCETMIIHLGDGNIYSLKKGKIQCLMSPLTLFGHPRFVTTPEAYKMMKIEQKSIAKGEAVILCTDGMREHLPAESGRPADMNHVEMNTNIRLLNQRMKSLIWKDDASYAMIVHW